MCFKIKDKYCELASLEVPIHDMSINELVKYLNKLEDSCMTCVKMHKWKTLSIYTSIKLKVLTLIEDKLDINL